MPTLARNRLGEFVALGHRVRSVAIMERDSERLYLHGQAGASFRKLLHSRYNTSQTHGSFRNYQAPARPADLPTVTTGHPQCPVSDKPLNSTGRPAGNVPDPPPQPPGHN